MLITISLVPILIVFFRTQGQYRPVSSGRRRDHILVVVVVIGVAMTRRVTVMTTRIAGWCWFVSVHYLYIFSLIVLFLYTIPASVSVWKEYKSTEIREVKDDLPPKKSLAIFYQRSEAWRLGRLARALLEALPDMLGL